MATASGTAASRARGGRLTLGRDEPYALSAGDVAWLAALPCAAVTALAMLVLGPPLGRALESHDPLHFWPVFADIVLPEPTEQARYLIALGGPLLLTAVIAGGVRRAPRMAERTAAGLVTAVQALGLLVAIACFAGQRGYVYGPIYTGSGSASHTRYFTAATIAVACACAAGLAIAVSRPGVRARWHRLSAGTRPRALVATLLAAVAVAVWSLPAVNFDDTILAVHPVVGYHAQFSFDETYAVLAGRSPLVDFAAQYGSLLPYAIAAGMSVLGDSIGMLTLLGAAIAGLAMLALFDVLRRVTRSSVAALALFLPLLATSFFLMRGPLENRYALGNLFSAFPLRYTGPLLVAWLVAWQLDRRAARRAWLLFAAGGLALLNNADLGLAAVGASVAALLWTADPPWRGGLRRIALEAVAGLAVAFALVSALTLVRTGSLPHLELLFRYSRMFALEGFGMLPLRPTIGLALVFYLTYVAAIGMATVRAVRGEPDRLLTGMLAWSGVFGLGAGAYFVGRSHPEVLTTMFPAWALCLTLLTVVAIRGIAAAGSPRQITLAQLACLVGFGLMTCSLAQVPTPWSQLDRLEAKGPALLAEPAELVFVGEHTRPGEPVAILMLLGHRLALTLGVDDVTPYTGSASIATVEQLDETVDALRAAGGRKIFLSSADTTREVVVRLERRGYRRAGEDEAGTHMLIDARRAAR